MKTADDIKSMFGQARQLADASREHQLTHLGKAEYEPDDELFADLLHGDRKAAEPQHYERQDNPAALTIHELLERLRRWGSSPQGTQYLRHLEDLLRRDPSLRVKLSPADVVFINWLAQRQYEAGAGIQYAGV